MDGFVLEIPEMVGLPLSPSRTAQAATHPWPDGTIIVSADSHMLETDCWVDRFPEHMKHRAPRMEFRDGGYHLTVAGSSMPPPSAPPWSATPASPASKPGSPTSTSKASRRS
jgi:hypothetical protein